MKNVFKFFLVIAITAITVVNLSGCSGLQKKFTRKKKKEEKGLPHYHRIKEYNVYPSIELYTKHYIYWRNWHKEAVGLLGQNRKRDKRNIRETVGNLEDMKGMLLDEKGDELEKHIQALRKIEQKILRSELTIATKTRIRRKLEKELKLIKINFTYRKMEPFIRGEFRARHGKVEVKE